MKFDLKSEKKYLIMSFVVPFIMAVLVFLPFVIMDGGFFTYYADYNSQQIPFYEHCVRAIHSGNTGWDWHTDLGSGFVTSYGFYTLGSPFFWLTVLLPAECAKYMMAPLLALKMGLSSFFAYMYIRRFVKKGQSAFIGGVIYAFSGYSIYNIVYNHFLEVICFFPLLLYTLEEAVINKRRGMFAVAVAINALVNYFFFVGECVFLVLYFLCRCAMSKEFRIRVSDFFCLAFESVSGVMVAGVIMLPSVIQLMGSPDASSYITGNDFMFYENSQYYGNIIKSLFFVPDIAGQNMFFYRITYTWDSAAMYLPLFSMTGVIAFMSGVKKHWTKLLLVICLVCAFIPGLNAMFTMFNSQYYARWFYMPCLICAMITVVALENDDVADWKAGVAINTVIVSVMSLIILFHPVDIEADLDYGNGAVHTVSETYPWFMTTSCDDAYMFICATLVQLLAVYIFIRGGKRLSTAEAMKKVTVTVLSFSLLLGYGSIAYGRSRIADVYNYSELVKDELVIEDKNYRVEIETPYYREANLSMYSELPSALCFNSVVSNSIFEIYDYLDIIERTQISVQPGAYTAMRSLFGVKYYILHRGIADDYIESLPPEERANIDIVALLNTYMEGFEYIETQGDYYILENNNIIPMGYAYDEYILYEDAKGICISGELTIGDVIGSNLESADMSVVDRVAVEAVGITEEQAEKYSDILTQIDPATIENEMWTMDRFGAAVQARRDAGVTKFELRKNSFYAETDYADDELVVFSVPYDEGWSAFIDGEPAEIDKVNGGFVAIRVPAGKHSIDFTYKTPGLTIGIVLTFSGIILIAGWFVLWYAVLKKGVRKTCSSDTVSAHKIYIDRIVREDCEK